MKHMIYRVTLALSALEGVVLLIWLLRQPSMERNAWLFGYSPGRALLLAITLVCITVLAVLALLTLLRPRWLQKASSWWECYLLGADRLLVWTLALSTVFVLQVAFLLVGRLPLLHEYRWYAQIFPHQLQLYETLLVVYSRLAPLVIWSTLISLQILLATLALFADEYRRPGFWSAPTISNFILITLMGLISLLQWAFLRLQLPLMKLLPGYYWDVKARAWSPRYLIFLGMLIVSLLVVNILLKRQRPSPASLVLLLGLGYTIQVGFGMIEGRGFEYLRLKYADTGHVSYANIAAGEQPDLLDVVREYEQRYGWKMFPSTKPPGVVLFYAALEKAVNAIQPAVKAEDRVVILTRWMAYGFPFIAFLVPVAIYLLMRALKRPPDALLPSLLYIFIPNVLLIPLFLDQVLYPLLFTLGALLLWQAVQQRSVWLAFVGGLYCYGAVFFTFSLLTLLPLFLVMLGLDFWVNWKERKVTRAAALALAFAAGVIGLFIIFRLVLNYDFFQRYATAMRVVRNFDFVLRTGQKPSVDLTTTTVQPGLGQILRAALLNNLELAAAVGFPIVLLFLRRAGVTLMRVLRRRASEFDLVLGALCLTYLALNLYGQVQGEVARLWIFWVPMLVIGAGVDLAERFRNRTLVVSLVVFLQLITTLMIFQYQDFLV